MTGSSYTIAYNVFDNKKVILIFLNILVVQFYSFIGLYLYIFTF